MLGACGTQPRTFRNDGAPTRATAEQRDPVIGPHAAADLQHSSDQLNLTPITPDMRVLPLIHAPAGRISAPTTVASSPKREIFGFAPYWLLSHYREWDYSALSTVAYFSLAVDYNGNFIQS